MPRWIIILSLVLLTVSDVNLVSAANDSDKEDIKLVIENIVNNEPFPVKVTDTRWVIDIDNELDTSDDKDSYQLPEQLIHLIAAFSKYILWLVLIILVVLAYFNRHLLNIEKIFSNKFVNKIQVTQIDEDTETVSLKDVMVNLNKLLTHKEYRRLTSLLYQTSIKTLDGVNLFTTETDIKDQLVGTDNELEEFFELLIGLRNKIAYRHIDIEGKDIDRLVTMWKKIYCDD